MSSIPRVLPLLLLAVLISTCRLSAQNLPDRIVVFNPLLLPLEDSIDFEWLNGIRLYAEFARYTNTSGQRHRWNAKTGGYIDFLRWDSTASVAFTGTVEVAVDPQSDISFNPRAIFWEEGLIATFRLAERLHLQTGYMHRCKHDIDNLEILYSSGVPEQRVLIYSSIPIRLLHRRRLSADDAPIEIDAHLAVRNDFFTHLLDDRHPQQYQGVGRDLESLLDAINLTGRLDVRPADGRLGVHLLAGYQLSLFGRSADERYSGITADGSVPMLELGVDLFNRNGGAAFTIFARAEWQNDGGIAPVPEEASLVLFGIRTTDVATMW